MHILTLVETDPRNFESFEDWINSRDYGSRAYAREIRLYDLNVKEAVRDEFLADLKHYEKGEIAGESKAGMFYRMYVKILKLFNFILPMNPIDMERIEPTPEESFEPIDFPCDKVRKSGNMDAAGNWLYLKPLGFIKDRFHKGGNEII